MARRLLRRLTAAAGLCAAAALPAGSEPAPPAPGAIRVAAYNTALSRRAPGALVQALRLGDDRQVAAVVEVVQRVRPDVILLMEIDHDPEGEALRLFAEALREGRNGAGALDYPHRFTAPVNTGVPSGFDLDGDGETGGPGDAWGWGAFPGQYGMGVLSRLQLGPARTFRTLRWAAAPDALIPPGHYPPEAEPMLRLSSKSHWDLSLDGGRLRLLASHPTPPVFDGPEDANGRRNADELRFWRDYLDGASWMTDDAGVSGGHGGGPFVLLGDLNADPEDGDGRREAIRALLAHPALQDPSPVSEGGRAATSPDHAGPPERDTADWRTARGPGALRVDFVLPSADLTVTGSGVFWPAPEEPLARLVGGPGKIVSSDHRLVWVDVILP